MTPADAAREGEGLAPTFRVWGSIENTRQACAAYYGRTCRTGSQGPCGASNGVAYFEREILLKDCVAACAAPLDGNVSADTAPGLQYWGLDGSEACRRAFCHSVNSSAFEFDSVALSLANGRTAASPFLSHAMLVVLGILLARCAR